MKLGDFLNTLATNSGIATDDANLKKILSSATISDYDIPDEVASKIQEGHLTLESAKANPAIINHFREAHLSRIDKDLYSTLEELGVDETNLNELKGIKSTYEKNTAAFKKLAELTKKQASAAGEGATGKAAELQKAIDALNAKITETNNQAKTEKDALLASFDGERKGWVLDNLLSNYEYAGDQPKAVQMQLAKILLEQKLKENNYQTKYENSNLELVTNDGTPVFDNNTKVSLKALTDKLVADNKLIKVSGANQQTGKTGATNYNGAGQFNGKAPEGAPSPYDIHAQNVVKDFQTA